MSEGVQQQKGKKQQRPGRGNKHKDERPWGGPENAALSRSRAAVQVYGRIVRKRPTRRGCFAPNEILFKFIRNLVNSVQSGNSAAAVTLLETLERALSTERIRGPADEKQSFLASSDWDKSLIQSILYILQGNSTLKARADLQKRSEEVARHLQLHIVTTSSSLKMESSLPSGGNPSMEASAGIVNVLADVGSACTWSASTFRETLSGITSSLSSASSLDEAAISRIIYFFSDKSNTPSGETGGWNLSVVSQVIAEDYSGLDWMKVAAGWDFDAFEIRNVDQFRMLLELYRSGAKRDPPLVALTSEWRHPSAQCSLLEGMLYVPPSVFSCPLNSEEAADAATAGPEAQTSSAPNTQCWASSDVLQRLLQLSDMPSLVRRTRDLFVKGLLSCPEVLLCALVRLQLNVANSNPQAGKQMTSELMRELIPLFFKPNPHHGVKNRPAALRRLWAISPGAVTAACREAWRSTLSDSAQTRLATVGHIISTLRLLPSPENAIGSLLNGGKDPECSIAVSFVMSDTGMLQLKNWLVEKISVTASPGPSNGFVFAVTLLSYVGKMHTLAIPRSSGNSNNDGKPFISYENVAISLQVLQSLDPALLSQTIPSAGSTTGVGSLNAVTLGEGVKGLAEACFSANPNLRSMIGQQPQSAAGLGANNGRVTPPSSGNADDIEEMANSYFQKIYTSEQSIGEVVEMLKRFKASSDPRENDIFACMIHNLFDEYRFFSKYPEKELRITGILFGTLIQQQLVSSITLGIALRYVLEALRKPPAPPGSTTHSSGKMFRFGMFALEQFKGRLHEWPQYCSHIVQIPHLKEGYAELVGEIENAMAASQNRTSAASSSGSANRASGAAVGAVGISAQKQQGLGGIGAETSSVGAASPTVVSTSSARSVPSQVELSEAALPPAVEKRVAVFGPKLGRAVNGKNEDVQHESPPDAVLDRVQFLINNVSPSNVEQKAQELKEMLEPTYFGWLGHYLVVKRISTQPNFHSLYLTFLNQLGDYGKGLVEAILASVYLNVGKLLRSPKITTSTSERSLLKNLGSWLGQITLARNRPILQIMLDCKELLLQGYENGMLIAVTPFVAKILEGAKSSVIFRPPNPWIMGLLSVFRALYGVDDLKMNIKFEVEVLCKNLGMKPEDIPIRTDLSSRISPVKERNPDFNMKSSMVSSAPAASAVSNAVGMPVPEKMVGSGPSQGMSGGFGLPSGQGGSSTGQDQHQTLIPNIASYITISPSVTQLLQQTQGGPVASALNSASLKRAVPVAVDRAIREIMQPVIERSVSIASISTKELVTKDFAMESDENKVRKAAQLMGSSLAGSLALVTCREPLRASVSTHLRQLLTSNIGATEKLSEQDQNLVEQCVAICATDNLDLSCRLIEKAASERAARDVDEAMASAVNTRRKHREQTGQPYYDMSIFGNGSQRYPASLPEPLRPKPGGLRSEQLRVYEAFQRMPRQASASAAFGSPGGVPTSRSGVPSTASNAGADVSGTGQQLNIEVLSAIASKLNNAVTTLLSSVGPRAPEVTLSVLPADHEIRQLLVAVQRLIQNATIVGGALSPTEKDAALGFSQSIFKRLYELSLSEPLRLEVLVALLERVNEYCPQLGQNIGTWATYAPTDTETQRKLHKTVLLLLLRSRLVSSSSLDSYLSASADSGRNLVWVEFSLYFMRTAFLERLASPSDFPKLMDLMTSLAEGRNQASQQVNQSLRTSIVRVLEDIRGTPANLDSNTAITASAGMATPDEKKRQQSLSVLECSSLSAASLNNFAETSKRVAEACESLMARDPPNAKQQVTFLLDTWIRKHNEAASDEKILAQYLQLLQQHGVGKVEEQTERFFRLSTMVVVEAVLKSSGAGERQSKGQALNYSFIDIYSKLVVVLIRYMHGGGSPEQVATQRATLLNKILGVTVRCMMFDYEVSKKENGGVTPNWDQRPWFRLILNWMIDLSTASEGLDPSTYGALSLMGAVFHMVQPLVFPCFSFAWLELVSHRLFLPNLLVQKGQKGWNLAHQIILDLFLFLEPHLRMADLTPPVKKLYEGTLRILLVLLHDFPSFLASYHLSLCNVIPDSCVQLRNLILSAVPKGMVLPDPFTPNLKIDLLPEISHNPIILSNYQGPLEPLRADLDAYLKDRQLGDFLQSLLPRLCKDGTTEVDLPRVNSLVLYVGMQAISRQSNQVVNKLPHTPEMEILQKLMEFDEKGRYACLNAIANQLRYPNSHTHFFSCVMLVLFSEAKNVAVKEQITRVLLERLILHRPHPWGLLITFIELIKNQRYQFWSHSFTRCANEIEKMFESVARSCLTPGAQRSAAVGGDAK